MTSGLVRSRQFSGVYWVHNDSGNPPALFAVKRDGTLIREYRINVANVDWEDIATDDHGHLYIGEIGNNDSRLPLRAIYQVDEPDPSKEGEILLRLKKASYYRFPPKEAFDAEALMVDPKSGELAIIDKTDAGNPQIYEAPGGLTSGSTTTLTDVGTLPLGSGGGNLVTLRPPLTIPF